MRIRLKVRKDAQPLGYILYQGPSAIDGAPIVVILTGFRAAQKATGDGANSKNGAMLQTYILRADRSPLDAIATMADKSICGACPHRGVPERNASGKVARMAKRTCYVQVERGPTVVYRTWQRGRYVDATGWNLSRLQDLVRGYGLRWGSYGDPAAIPAHTQLVPALSATSAMRTGYTHQWRNRLGAHLRGYVQASCDTAQDLADAKRAGWGTFTVLPHDADPWQYPFPCPASEESGRALQCIECGACDGNKRAHITILAHGSKGRQWTGGRKALPVLA